MVASARTLGALALFAAALVAAGSGDGSRARTCASEGCQALAADTRADSAEYLLQLSVHNLQNSSASLTGNSSSDSSSTVGSSAKSATDTTSGGAAGAAGASASARRSASGKASVVGHLAPDHVARDHAKIPESGDATVAVAQVGVATAAAEASAAEASQVARATWPPIVIGAVMLCTLLGFAMAPAVLPAALAKYVAEFLGTFVLVLTVSNCVLGGNPVWNATAIACSLMVMIYATGAVSGGNLNPAVSLALGLTGNLELIEVIKYWVAQILGGLAAAAVACSIHAPNMVSLAPVAPFSGSHAMVVEVIYTFMLCFVVLNCAASKQNNSPTDGNQFFALAIGFVIVAGGYAVGGISGAAFNPAVAIALDVKHAGFSWGIWYGLFELIGGALAALLYKIVRPAEKSGGDFPSDYQATLPTKLMSEFLGTFMLVITVGLNIITGSAATAFSAAASLMCMIYSLGNVSGAHFNPAVTVACVCRGACGVKDGVAYALVQTIAGCCAGLVAGVFHAASSNKDITYALKPGAGYTFSAACFAELFFTFVLAYTVLATATIAKPSSQPTSQNFYFGLSIGSCVTAGGFAIGAVSGGELNPAVSAGIAMLGTMSPGSDPLPPYTYLVGFILVELLGGLCAAAVFRFSHQSPAASNEAAALVCEFVGTFALVFTVGCCVISGSSTWNATAIAAVLMVMIYSTGPVSGGNLNPAVSLSLGLTGGLPWPKVFQYWVAQLLAGAAAGGAYVALFAPKTATLAPVTPFSWPYALLAEAIYTCMLCFVVLNCAASKRNNPRMDGNQFFALAIGFVIIAGGYAAGNISGACFNPSVALGVDIKHVGFHWGIVWALAEMLGAAMAAALYRAVRPDEKLSDDQLDAYEPSLSTKCLSEFLGTFMLVLTVGLNVVMASPAVAWSAAASLMCMIYSLGGVSGGHFNPAVTLAVVTSGRGKCSSRDGVAYTATQLLAGFAAGLVTKLFHAAGPNSEAKHLLQPGEGHSFIDAGLAEFFFTAVLAYIVLAVATTTPEPGTLKTKQNFQFALCIGSCVTAGGFAIGSVSGGELNPAVAVGISTQALSLGSLVCFVLWELCGGLISSIALRLTHPGEFTQAKA
mmetsp:Transcript_62426/g.157972  ORF Transcript_62426/g.157972 Transcript_62426/m.157972 type:complete len:1101 (+) Transcript_62426:114-3416(+)